jgi:hypothetical protein
MANFVDIANESVAVGIDPATLSAAMKAVPVPLDIADLGLRVTADNNAIVVNNVTRTVQLGFSPSAPAAVPVISRNADGAIQPIVLAARGLDWIRPPIVTVNPGAAPVFPLRIAQLQAFLRVHQIDVPVGGGGIGYSGAPRVRLIGGLPPAGRVITSACVRRIAITNPGLGYAPGTVAVIEGGGNGGSSPLTQAKATITQDAFGRITSITLTDMGAGYIQEPVVNFVPPGGVPPNKRAKASVALAEGTPALAHATVVAGVITGIVLDAPGSGYVAVPDVVITDPTGTGAIAIARMELDRIDVRSPGLGYTATSSIVITPFFKAAFPDAADQSRPFFGFMNGLLRDRVITPILTHTPVLS